jgi:hypothetical protein
MIKKISKLFIFLSWLLLCGHAQINGQVGIGTPLPASILHIFSEDWTKTRYENTSLQPALFVGHDPAGTLTFSSGEYFGFNTWVYQHQSFGAYKILLHRLNNAIEFRTRAPMDAENTRLRIGVQGNVSIGNIQPQQNLSVEQGVNLDQANTGNGFAPTLRFGSSSADGLGSRRIAGEGQNGIDFVTAGLSRMRINNDGRVGLSDVSPIAMFSLPNDMVINQSETGNHPHLGFGNNTGNGIGLGKVDNVTYRMNFFANGSVRAYISQAGNLHIGNTTTGDKLNVDGNMSLSRFSGTEWMVDRTDANTGAWGASNPVIRFGSVATGEGIGSKRNSGDRRWGIDFYTSSQRRMSVLNNGTLDLTGNLFVQNNKGVLRSTGSSNEKLVYTSASLNRTFGPNETFSFLVNFSETFSSPPDVWVVNRGPGAGQGGWAEVLITITDVTNTQCRVWVFNTFGSNQLVNMALRVAAMGPQ